MIRINAGDSWWEDIDRTDGQTLPADASGAWAIVTALGETAVASGGMTLAADLNCLQMRIAPTDTADIAPNTADLLYYLLVKQISSTSLGLSTEIINTIKISPAGIP